MQYTHDTKNYSFQHIDTDTVYIIHFHLAKPVIIFLISIQYTQRKCGKHKNIFFFQNEKAKCFYLAVRFSVCMAATVLYVSFHILFV